MQTSAHAKTVNAGKAFRHDQELRKSQTGQPLRQVSDLHFVKPDAKQRIIAALAEGGYGISFQEGIVSLLNRLLAEHNKEPIT